MVCEYSKSYKAKGIKIQKGFPVVFHGLIRKSSLSFACGNRIHFANLHKTFHLIKLFNMNIIVFGSKIRKKMNYLFVSFKISIFAKTNK